MKEILGGDRFRGILVSFAAHAALIAGGGLLVSHPVEYSVDPGLGGVEVHLVAAPAEEAAPDPAAAAVEAPKPDPDGMPLMQNQIETRPLAPKIEPPKSVVTAPSPLVKGDGSSPEPGLDPTTFHSSAGAVSEMKPDYLRNPAPPYPAEARQNGWQGVVVLKVFVDRAGRAREVEKESSSGYDVLDESAMRTVKKWRFRPARAGSISLECVVRVPIRFELDKK